MSVDLGRQSRARPMRRNGVAIGLPDHAKPAVDPQGAHHSGVIGQGRSGCELGLLFGEQVQRRFMRLAVETDIGNGLQPMTACWIKGRPGRQFQAAQEVLFDVFHAALHAPFLIALFHAAGSDPKAVVIGEVQVTRIDLSGLAKGVAQDRGFTVVNHDTVGHASKEGERVLMTLEEVLLALP
jgi:hypothetical protein